MKSSIKLHALAFASFTLLTCASQAAVLASYNFNTDQTATTFDPSVAAGAFSQVGDLAPLGEAQLARSGSGNLFQRSTVTAATEAAALVSTQYHTVTIAADPGFTLNLSSLTLLLGQSQSNAGTFTTTLVLSSDVLGFATAIAGTGGITRTTTDATGATFFNASDAAYDLSAPAYQGLSSITFRLTVFDNQTTNSKISRFDNFALNGVANVIPEPSTALLCSLGLLALMRRRRC